MVGYSRTDQPDDSGCGDIAGDLVNYFAESVDNFSGTSLAAQNLNEMKKAKIFAIDGQTVIELDLNFDRAWSSVSRAMTAANIVSNDGPQDEHLSFFPLNPLGPLSPFGPLIPFLFLCFS